nr:hypothetical protein CTI12_AA583410 [Tanacetum cinerariifolium]
MTGSVRPGFCRKRVFRIANPLSKFELSVRKSVPEGGSSFTSFCGEERQRKACSLLHTNVRTNNPWSTVPDYQDGTCPDPDIHANKSFLTDFHYEGEMCGAFAGQKRKHAESQRRRGRRRVTNCEILSPSTVWHKCWVEYRSVGGVLSGYIDVSNRDWSCQHCKSEHHNHYRRQKSRLSGSKHRMNFDKQEKNKY